MSYLPVYLFTLPVYLFKYVNGTKTTELLWRAWWAVAYSDILNL